MRRLWSDLGPINNEWGTNKENKIFFRSMTALSRYCSLKFAKFPDLVNSLRPSNLFSPSMEICYHVETFYRENTSNEWVLSKRVWAPSQKEEQDKVVQPILLGYVNISLFTQIVISLLTCSLSVCVFFLDVSLKRFDKWSESRQKK